MSKLHTLKELVAKRGESQHYACVFRGANLVFDPFEHAHSDMHQDTSDYLLRMVESDKRYRKFVSILSHADTVFAHHVFQEYFGLDGVVAYARKDPSDGFHVTFTIPQANAARFYIDVEVLSHIVIKWAAIAGSTASKFRVFIDYAFLRWEDMEEENLLYTEFESD